MTQTAARKRFPTALIATIAVVLLAVGAIAYFAVSVLTRDRPFSVEGTLQLNSESITVTGLPPGFNCAGSGGYGDIAPGAPVTVSDESGTLLAKSVLDSSIGGPGWCAFSFTVVDVPAGAKFYRVEAARRGDLSYTEGEARNRIELTVGDPRPEVLTTSAPPAPPPSRPAAAAPAPAGPVPADPGPPSYSTLCGSGGGYELANSAVGSSRTSCAFAESVRSAYLAQSRRGGTVAISAYSPVTGQTYRMNCSGSGVVTCRGGNDAIVYLY